MSEEELIKKWGENSPRARVYYAYIASAFEHDTDDEQFGHAWQQENLSKSAEAYVNNINWSKDDE